MVKRKKRLKKGIISLEKQVVLHEKKRETAIEKGNIWLDEYYRKEIIAKEEDIKKKENKLNRKKKRK